MELNLVGSIVNQRFHSCSSSRCRCCGGGGSFPCRHKLCLHLAHSQKMMSLARFEGTLQHATLFAPFDSQTIFRSPRPPWPSESSLAVHSSTCPSAFKLSRLSHAARRTLPTRSCAWYAVSRVHALALCLEASPAACLRCLTALIKRQFPLFGSRRSFCCSDLTACRLPTLTSRRPPFPSHPKIFASLPPCSLPAAHHHYAEPEHLVTLHGNRLPSPSLPVMVTPYPLS